MKLQAIALFLTATLAIEITNFLGDGRYPAHQNINLAAHAQIQTQLDRRDYRQDTHHGSHHDSHRDHSIRIPLANYSSHDHHSDKFVVVKDAFRVHHNYRRDPNDGKLVPWKTKVNYVEGKFDKEIDQKLNDDEKNIKETEKIIEKDVALLKEVEKIEEKKLTQEQGEKAAKIEEQIIDNINKEQKKVEDLKADKDLKNDLKEVANEVKEIKKEEKKEESQNIFDAKIKEIIAIEEAQKKLAPKIIEQIQKEIRRDEENKKGALAEIIARFQAPMIRNPEIKEIEITKPLTPSTPLSESIVVVAKAEDGKGNKVFVGAKGA